METPKGYTAQVQFTVPPDLTAATFKVYRGTTQIGGSANAAVGIGFATVNIPYAAVAEEGEINIVLRFLYQGDSYEQTRVVEVITPLLTRAEITEIVPDATITEVIRIESAVRHVIQSHTGQSFGRFDGDKYVFGEGNNAIVLPARLISLRSMGVEGNAYKIFDVDYPATAAEVYLGRGEYVVTGDGWYIKKLDYSDLGIKADHSDYVSINGVIYNPYVTRRGHYSDDTRYVISGVWGYESVPSAVVEAARLLVNDYACEDSAYRDRYLTSMTAADWRIQFHSGAFMKTGNVRADQLLNKYVLKRGWAVI